MNVVDSLVVTLDLDSSAFDDKSKKAQDDLNKFKGKTVKVGADIADQGKKASEFFRQTRNEILGALAAFAGVRGFKDFVTTSINGQAALSRLSTNLDMSARRLDAWGQVAKQVGGNAEDSFAALQTVASGIAQAAIEGHSAFTDAAKASAIQLTDSKGKVLSYEQVLLKVSERMQQLNRAGQRQQALQLAQNLGLGGFSNELMLGPEELSKRINGAEAISRVTDESAKKAAELQKRWADIQQRFIAIGQIVWEKLEPGLERLAIVLADALDKVDWDKVIAQLTEFVSEVINATQELGGFKTVAIVLAGILSLKLLAPLAGLVGLMTRLAGLGGAATSVSSLGSALGAINATALASVAGIAAAVYSPALGGAQRADGSYADERPRNKSKEPSNNDLWNTVQGKPSGFPGDKTQAALLLAYRSYIDPQSQDTYESVSQDILSGKVNENTGWLMNSKRESTTAPTPAGAGSNRFGALEDQYGLPPGIMDRIWKKESSRGTGAAVSTKGAKGPFQFMDATAADYGLVGNDVNDLDKSSAAAAHYLSDLNKQFGGDWTKTLAAYNWGPGNVANKGLANAPAETRDYMTMAQGLQLGPRQQYGGTNGGVAGVGAASGTSNEINIQQLTVQSSASNLNGVVTDAKRAVAGHAIVANMNTGLE